MQHKTKCREHFLPIRVFLNSLNNDIVESNSIVVFKNKLQKYPLCKPVLDCVTTFSTLLLLLLHYLTLHHPGARQFCRSTYWVIQNLCGQVWQLCTRIYVATVWMR
jgi:hypothetical protein